MKQSLYILSFLLLAGSNLYAQRNTTSIIIDLNTTKAGQGKVMIYEDEAISGLIGSKPAEHDGQPVTNPANNQTAEHTSDFVPEQATEQGALSYKRVAGYKIQVYSGNDQRKSKNEADARKDKVKDLFPDMEVSVSLNAPVWRVRAGNFATYEQAFQVMKDMKKAFPSFGKELQIVKALIKLPMN